jgi:Zn-dependent protease with chaperone function
LTNAYGLSQSIAVTDNYGKFLNGPELDFVIGHELGHVKAQHGRKKLLIVGTVFAGIALACFFLPPILIPFRPLLDIPVMLSPVLTFYFFSRRFEYASDEAGLALTHDPENAIRALANLYRITQAPVHFDRLTELFMTHPPLTRRVRAIAESGAMPAERLSEVIDEMEVLVVVCE